MASVLRRHWQAFTASAQPFASEALEQANIIAMSLLPALLHFLEHLPAYCVFAAVAHFILKSMANMICRLLLNLVRCLTALSWAILALSEYIVGKPLPPGAREAARDVCEDHFARWVFALLGRETRGCPTSRDLDVEAVVDAAVVFARMVLGRLGEA